MFSSLPHTKDHYPLKRLIPWSSLDYIAQHGTPTHTHVVMTLLRLTCPITQRIEVTQDEIASAANLSKETIKRSLRWLSEHEIVSSARVPGVRCLVYNVHHRRMPNPAAATLKKRVMGDPAPTPSEAPKTAPDLGLYEIPALIVHSEGSILGTRYHKSKGTTSPYSYPAGLYNVNNGEGATVPDVILGADPDAVPEESPARAKKPRKPLNPTTDVLDYWNFVARREGARPVTTPQDRMIFIAQAKRLLGGGLTPSGLKSMITDFFRLDRNREHPAPHMVFFTKDTQRRLLSAVSSQVDVADEVLGWIARGFVRDGHDLPWPEEFDREFQNLVLRRALSLAYRYPEVVADIARAAHGDSRLATDLLTSATAMLESALSVRSSESPRETVDTLVTHGVILPRPLLTRTGQVRAEAHTLHEAVLIACSYA